MGQAATATITCPEAAQAMAQKHVEDVNMGLSNAAKRHLLLPVKSLLASSSAQQSS
jgi:hypothetical protein